MKNLNLTTANKIINVIIKLGKCKTRTIYFNLLEDGIDKNTIEQIVLWLSENNQLIEHECGNGWTHENYFEYNPLGDKSCN